MTVLPIVLSFPYWFLIKNYKSEHEYCYCDTSLRKLSFVRFTFLTEPGRVILETIETFFLVIELKCIYRLIKIRKMALQRNDLKISVQFTVFILRIFRCNCVIFKQKRCCNRIPMRFWSRYLSMKFELQLIHFNACINMTHKMSPYSIKCHL